MLTTVLLAIDLVVIGGALDFALVQLACAWAAARGGEAGWMLRRLDRPMLWLLPPMGVAAAVTLGLLPESRGGGGTGAIEVACLAAGAFGLALWARPLGKPLLMVPARLAVAALVGLVAAKLATASDPLAGNEGGRAAARLAHLGLAALLAGGVWLHGFGGASIRRGAMPADVHHGRSLAKLGALIGLVATLFEVIVGIWLLLALPEPVRMAFFEMGRPAALLWIVSLGAVLLLLVALVVALALPERAAAHGALWSALLLVLAGMFVGHWLAAQPAGVPAGAPAAATEPRAAG